MTGEFGISHVSDDKIKPSKEQSPSGLLDAEPLHCFQVGEDLVISLLSAL